MDEHWLHLDGDSPRRPPGAGLTGKAGWKSAQPVESAEIRLFWYTAGIGARDVKVVETIPIERPGPVDEQPFALTLPAGPYSFSGQLVSLIWGLELVLEPGTVTERVEFELSPFDEPIVLPRIEELKNKRAAFRVGA
jgi:hypothetical protein